MVLKHIFFKTAIGHKLPDHPVTASKHWIEVKDVMTTDIATISPDKYVTDAAKIMAVRNISCIIVTDNGTMKGIITERDLVKTVADKKEHHTKVKVKSVMSREIITVSPHFTVLKASKMMGVKKIRRLPVIGDKELIGIVTQTDLTRALTAYGLGSSVEEIMTQNVAKVQDTASVSDAVKIMAKSRISCVLCMEKDRVSGIISERDMIKKILALKKDPSKVHVKEIMYSHVIDAHPSLSVFSAGRLMERMNIRRLVIMNDKQLLGVVTQTDIFLAIKKKLHGEEEMHMKLLENSEYCVYTSNLDGIITYVNPAFMKLFEVSDQKVFLNKPFIPPQFWSEQKDREEFIERHKKTFINSEELSLLNSKGKKIYLIISSSFTKDIHGKINGIQGLVRNITQEKDIVSLIETQDALRQSEEKYRNLVETIEEQIWEVNAKGIYTYISPTSRDIYGLEPDEVIGKTPFDLMPKEESKHTSSTFKKVLKTKMPFTNLETIAQHKDGRCRIMETNGVPFFKPGGKLLGYRGTARDITERKKAQEALQESEEKYRLITENASDMIAVATFALNPKYIYLSPSHKAILGYDTQKYIGKACFDLMHPDDKKNLLPIIRKYLKAKAEQFITGKDKQQCEQVECRVKDIRGRWHDLESYVTIMKDELLIVSRDITDRKKTGEALRQSEERYRVLFESATEGILIADIKTRKFMYANHAICRMLGYTERELKQMILSDIHPKDKLKHILSEFEAQAKGEKMLASDIPCLKKDRTIIYADINTTATIIDGIKCNIGFFRDITERKKFEIEKEDHTAKLQEKTSDLELANAKLKGIQDKLNSQIDLLERFKKATIDDVLEMKKIEEENNDLKEELRRLKHED